ncbi:MAG: rhomboid family intramembrane serine protease [Bacteroides sp.]|nr:rhomboid family intramembrane serine protease [Bacteroides sp.]MBD5374815.1 rhomboid family intramembrane serine protease [Bacteroides sp.]MDE7460307.1 rhomboid family intramembrane serine protease [Paramuribaculum sp.]
MRTGSIFSNIPPVTKNLIIINFIVWIAMMVLGSRVDFIGIGALHYIKAPDFNPVQLLTYMFMHSTHDLAHIVFNMFTLFMFGITLERVLGSARFLFYYISCGIGAALVQELVWSWTWEDMFVKLIANSNGIDFEQARSAIHAAMAQGMDLPFLNSLVTVGASGAIYGVLLAFGMLFPNMPLYIMFIPVPIKAKWMVIGYGVIELLIGLSNANDGVAHFAHLGGMIFGFIMIYFWRKKGLFNGPRY